MSYTEKDWEPTDKGVRFRFARNGVKLDIDLARHEVHQLALDTNEAEAMTTGYEMIQQMAMDINPLSKIYLVDTFLTVSDVLYSGDGYCCIQFEGNFELSTKFDRMVRAFVPIQ